MEFILTLFLIALCIGILFLSGVFFGLVGIIWAGVKKLIEYLCQ